MEFKESDGDIKDFYITGKYGIIPEELLKDFMHRMYRERKEKQG
jgi:hypothetical protein